MAPRILIVDDEDDFIELVRFRLAAQGYEFLVATDGVQALTQARQARPRHVNRQSRPRGLRPVLVKRPGVALGIHVPVLTVFSIAVHEG